MQILSIILAFIVQAFLVFAGRKKLKDFRINPWFFTMFLILFLIVLFCFINTYKLLQRDRYFHLTQNLLRIPDESDYIISFDDTSVFYRDGMDRETERENQRKLHSDPLGVKIDNVVDHLYSDDHIFIDIRPPRQYNACTIKRAMNIPADELKEKINLYRDKTIYLFGNGDLAASGLAKELNKEGYKAFYVYWGLRRFACWGSGFFIYTYKGKDISFMPRFLHPRVRPLWFIPDGELSKDDYRELDGKTLFSKNVHKLWDTVQVKKKLISGGIILIDVRPVENRHDYILSIPVSQLTVEEIESRIAGLPHDKGIILICDDMFSAFEAEWLGCQLTRKEYNYLGRYANPQEFFLPGREMLVPFEWNIERVMEYVRFAFEHLHFYLRHYCDIKPWDNLISTYSFLLFIFLLRLTISPLTYASHYYRLITSQLLKERVHRDKDFNTGIFSVLKMMNEVNPVNPLMKLFYAIPDILLILLAFAIAYDVNDSSKFLNPLMSDALKSSISISLVTGVLFYLTELHNPLYTDLRNRNCKNALFLPFPALFAFLMAVLGALFLPAVFMAFLGLNYLISLFEITLIRTFVSLREKDKERRKESPEEKEERVESSVGNIPSEIFPGIFDLTGNFSRTAGGGKAFNLGVMSRQGIKVPRGFVLTADFFKLYTDLREVENILFKVWDQYGFDTAAVRSSAGREDGFNRSYAGIFESVTDVVRDGLIKAVGKVRDSYGSSRVSAYDSGEGGDSLPDGGIIVQEMIRGEYRGVLFSVDPQDPVNISLDIFSDRIGVDVFEKEIPLRVIVGRKSGKILNIDENDTGINRPDINALIQLGRQVEKLFRTPQDMEWVSRSGDIFILQSRNITYGSLTSYSDITAEKVRLLKKAHDVEDVIWKFNKVSEVLPFPGNSSLSLFRKMWESHGPIDLAYRSFGLPYNSENKVKSADLLETVFGRLYINRKEEARLLIEESFHGHLKALQGRLSIEYALRTLYKSKDIYRNVCFPEDMKKSLPGLSGENELFQVFSQCIEHLMNTHLVQVFRINIVLDYGFRLLEKKLEGTGISLNEIYPAMGFLSEAYYIREGESIEEFLIRYGHHSSVDYELSAPRYYETPSLLRYFSENKKNVKIEEGGEKTSLEEVLRQRKLSVGKIKELSHDVALLSAYFSLKERGRDITVKYFAVIREIMLSIGEFYQMGDDIFNLSTDEIMNLPETGFSWYLKEKTASISRMRKVFDSINLPLELRVEDIERAGLRMLSADVSSSSSELRGIRVSGRDAVTGTVRVILELEDCCNIEKGEILVTPFASPQWSILLPQAAGMVTDSGGMLSHLAIVSRETGIPYIAGCKSASSKLKTGDKIKLMPDGCIIKMSDDD